MKIVAQVALGILIAGAVLYGMQIVIDTRARIVSTHVMTSDIYGRVFPERRVQPPQNQSPDGPHESKDK